MAATRRSCLRPNRSRGEAPARCDSGWTGRHSGADRSFTLIPAFSSEISIRVRCVGPSREEGVSFNPIESGPSYPPSPGGRERIDTSSPPYEGRDLEGVAPLARTLHPLRLVGPWGRTPALFLTRSRRVRRYTNLRSRTSQPSPPILVSESDASNHQREKGHFSTPLNLDQAVFHPLGKGSIGSGRTATLN